METKDYIEQLLQQYSSVYLNTKLDDTSPVFTTQSMSDFFNDLTSYQTYQDFTDQYTVKVDDNPSNPKEVTADNAAALIGTAIDLIRDHEYTSTQCIVIHNRHFEKVQKLLHEFYQITVTADPEKSKYEQYLNTLIFLNSSFKVNQNAVLTKAGMQCCNDIYNWYEGIKGHINQFGAERT